MFFLHVESFCALDLNVIRARYWSRAIPPPGTRREPSEMPERNAQNVPVQMLDKRGRDVYGFFKKSYRVKVAHEVHALFLGGTEAVRQDDDDFQRVSETRNSFPKFCNSANSRSTSFSKWKVFCETICSGSRMRRNRWKQKQPSRDQTRSAPPFFTDMGLLQRHIKYEHLNKWSPGPRYVRANLVTVEIPKETWHWSSIF